MWPPARKAKSKAATKISGTPPLPLKGKKTFEKVFYGDEMSDTSNSDSDYSDFSSSRKLKSKNNSSRQRKKRKTSHIRRSPTPEAPLLSDCEYHNMHDENQSITISKGNADSPVKIKTTPATLTFHIPCGPTTVNLNMANFLETWASSQHLRASMISSNNVPSLLSISEVQSPSYSSVMSVRDDFDVGSKKRDGSFLNLGPELRNRVYRLVFVTESAIRFYPSARVSRETALLQTCHQVHNEARGILYGENSFHFERVNEKRGPYYSPVWKEIGYKDVRRFLEDIGLVNRSLLRYISIDFTDACPHLTPTLEIHERRFVNDPVILSVLNLISSSGARLERFAVGFKGRQHVHREDFYFLKALTDVRCYKLIHSFACGNAKVNVALLNKMKEVMEIPVREDVDEDKKRTTTRMLHEKPKTSAVRGFDW